MATHGKNLSFLFGGADLSRAFSELNKGEALDATEVTCFQPPNDAKEYLAGTGDGSMSLQGYFKGGEDEADEVLSDAVDNNTVVSVAQQGHGTIGNRCALMDVYKASYEVSTDVNGAVATSMELQGKDGIDHGVVLADLAARTADGQTSAHDGGASSANGGVAHLNVTAFSGFTGVDIVVQHSTDGETWADLVTFEDVAAIGGVRSVVTAGTTVQRYLRVTTDVTGTGSITFAVGFARR